MLVSRTLFLLVFSFLATVNSGCASTPSHKWGAVTKANHIPMQGLPAIHRLVMDDEPLQLINFDKEKLDDVRNSKLIWAVTYGALDGCITAPSMCAIIGPISALLHGNQSYVVNISAKEADQLATIFKNHITSTDINRLVLGLDSNDDQPKYPYLSIEAEVLLVPTHDGLAFLLILEAQGFPKEGEKWKPSLHSVPFPTYGVDDWLANDAQLLESSIQTASQVAVGNVLEFYLPYALTH